MRLRYPLTPERLAYLRAHYDSQAPGRAQQIARALGVPVWRVKRWAAVHGLATRLVHRHTDWTPDEIAFLEAHVGTKSVPWIAKHLPGRSVTAVIVKLKRLAISRRDARDWFTATQVGLGFGIDPHEVVRWIERAWLPATRFGADHGDRVHAWRITEDGIRRFVRAHPTAFSLAKVDQVWFLSLLFGDVGERRERGAA